MEIKQLKYFLTVSEVGSFSRAAVALSVAQPALSRQIRSLEEELGMELLYRNGRGIVVTDAGQVLVAHARSIIDSARAVASEIDTLRADPSCRLDIGMPPTASALLTVPLVRRVREVYPRVKLKVDVGYSGHVLEWLSTGRIDVAVLYDSPKTSTLLTQPLIREELFLIGSRETPARLRSSSISAMELSELPMILPSNPHGLRHLVETILGGIKVTPNIVCEIDDLDASLKLVELGLGYTILPYAAVVEKIKAEDLVAVPIVSPRIIRQLVLATSTQRPVTLVTRALTRMMTQLVRDLVQEGIWVRDLDCAQGFSPPHASQSCGGSR